MGWGRLLGLGLAMGIGYKVAKDSKVFNKLRDISKDTEKSVQREFDKMNKGKW